jgi:hypothetical protein
LNVTIEVDSDQLNTIVRADLKLLLESLEDDLSRNEANKRGSIFSMDFEEDQKEIKKHIKAFKRVLKYYGEAL